MDTSIDRWLTAAVADVKARRLDAAVPTLEALAGALAMLRAEDWRTDPRLSAGAADAENPGVARNTAIDTSASPAGAAGTSRSAAVDASRTDANGDPHTLDIATASERIRGGALTSLALTESCLSQIDRLNASLNAFITITRDAALAAAREADAEIARGRWRGPLHGIPISLKDLIDQRGVITTAASHARDRQEAAADAPVTAALRHAGAVLIGKTNLHEYAFGTTSDESAFGPVRHPVATDRSPGGSSGGSAVAVATGMSLASIGTDTGGSIRIPAAACGLVGLKPGIGEVSCDGVVPLSWTLDHVGPLARSVADAAMVYRALAGLAAAPITPRPVAELRIGVLRDYFEDLLEPDVSAAVHATHDRLRRAGARLHDVRLPHAAAIAAIYLAIVFGEGAAVHGVALDSRGERYQPGVRVRLEAARFTTAEDYVRAMRAREVIRAEIDGALHECDALTSATLPIGAPVIGAVEIDVDGRTHPIRNVMLRLTQPFNITGHPAATLPCGETRERLPVGLQLVGRRGATTALLEVALACEQCLDERRQAGD
jgi:aspartyl-tRNA(Asn)/glutamyl-tRNA(Gln) amidotransferase subunit A